MALSLTDVQQELAASIRELADKRAPLSQTRTRFDALTGGDAGTEWGAVTEQGLHSIHLSEDVGGMGGTTVDLAVAVTAAGEALLAGPFVPTVFASALALQLGADDEILARFADGASAAVVRGELNAGATGDGG
ncbi:MAG: acyl-CoA dehydrogenase family protein, partial [Agromyces sp.]